MLSGGVKVLLAVCASALAKDSLEVLGGDGSDGGFTTLSPDPDLLQWDPTSSDQNGFRSGWLNVPVLHDPYITAFEKSPRMCLRVLMKPARKQPAKNGAILLHCGGPGKDAECAWNLGEKWFQLNSSYVVSPALSEDYDYWSISQRGVQQEFSRYPFSDNQCPFNDTNGNRLQAWPYVSCDGLIEDLKMDKGLREVLRRIAGKPDLNTWSGTIEQIRNGPSSKYFGMPFFNETYARWAYQLMALELNLCYNDPKYQVHSRTTNRSFNILDRISTGELAHDIELFRTAIGAKKMSVFGLSYGTKVGSVYATLFPDKVHRLVLDGDMGVVPDVKDFADGVGQSTEAVWTGVADACDNSVMAGVPPEMQCPAGPGVTSKLYKLIKTATSEQEKDDACRAVSALDAVIYEEGVPGAASLMKCIAQLYDNQSTEAHCPGSFDRCDRYQPLSGLGLLAGVLGMDIAGRLTEESFIEWWRNAKESQPLGITRSLAYTIAVSAWPAIPRPNPPAGDPQVSPLVIGNLHDGQTPYTMAQRMIEAFPNGKLLTTQFYGHGLQGPSNIAATVKRYEDEMRAGLPPTFDNDVAKLLCVKVALDYLNTGNLPRDYICKAAEPVMTGPGFASASKSLTDFAPRMPMAMLVSNPLQPKPMTDQGEVIV